MNRDTRRSMWVFIGMLALAVVSWLVFRGYLTPQMMVYFLTFQWCL
jgi:hypothetical protein